MKERYLPLHFLNRPKGICGNVRFPVMVPNLVKVSIFAAYETDREMGARTRDVTFLPDIAGVTKPRQCIWSMVCTADVKKERSEICGFIEKTIINNIFI
jgi:hypothetical protein